MNKAFLILVLLAVIAFAVPAHEVRPAYLELRQTGAETFDVYWKVPGRGDNLRLSLDVDLPTNCQNISPPRGAFGDNAFTQRWSIRCSGGLTGGTIEIAGLKA